MYRWARDGAVRAEHATVARFWFYERFALGTLVEILARVHRHDFLPRVAAVRASQYRFKDDRAHGFDMTFEGKPAPVVA